MYLTQGLHRSVQQNPDGIAVIGESGDVTFRQLEGRVARIGGGLRGLGVRSGDRIGMLATNCAQYVEFTFACPWIGAVASPVNNRWSLDEMAFQIEDAGISVLFVDAPRLAQALELRDRCPLLETVICFDGTTPAPGVVDYEWLIESSEPVSDVRPDPDSLAVLMYTGGTTGRPKGVMLSARQILTSAFGALASVGFPNTAERCLHIAPLFHLAAFAGMIQQSMLGATHVVIGDFTVEGLVETIAAKQITMTTLVPTMVPWMLDHAERTGASLSSLRYIGYGAAPMPEAVLTRLLTALPHVKLRQAYGMTELGPVATVLRDEDHHDRDHPERLRSVGRAAAHAEVVVVNKDGVEQPRGKVGEVVVRGAHVMIGYWNNPVETQKALQDGWMHTGDMGYMYEHGYLFLVDRLKDMIVSGGENVYSAEVEAVIHRHEAIASCAVIGVPDEVWGERVHAVVVLVPGASVTPEELRDYVGERIARYKAPRTVEFIDQMPLSPVGKILKRTLRDAYTS